MNMIYIVFLEKKKFIRKKESIEERKERTSQEETKERKKERKKENHADFPDNLLEALLI